MGNNVIQYLIDYLVKNRILVGLSLVFLGLLAVPFWKTNLLDIYDAPVHVSLVWYI